MRLVWVPQWTVLPVIVEDRAMGDEQSQHRSQQAITSREDVAGSQMAEPHEDILTSMDFPSATVSEHVPHLYLTDIDLC